MRTTSEMARERSIAAGYCFHVSLPASPAARAWSSVHVASNGSSGSSLRTSVAVQLLASPLMRILCPARRTRAAMRFAEGEGRPFTT